MALAHRRCWLGEGMGSWGVDTLAEILCGVIGVRREGRHEPTEAFAATGAVLE
jgi:hypothetical protein